jgi:uncharacterized circularly permuted ATP-grasp superfamily protein/uncharacterized alpha-E superfamily protein
MNPLVSPTPAGERLRIEYPLPPGVYDEMFAAPGVPRPVWAPLARALAELGPQEMARRWTQARRLIHENGVTYNVYGDPQGMDRPWELDAVPLLVGAAEWRALAGALAQRARLLNAILADLYGAQTLLHDGSLPAELVFAHPGFLRPCHGISLPEACHLHLFAADLARSPDGRWWVIGDRAQAPSGAGYALENRLALSRSLPEPFRDCHVTRLAGFFASVRAMLARVAPRHGEQPRVVLLTPGPFNETYFEHAYLARYLGYTLVEGGDLTVRDRVVYAKTLEGLERVDVVVRRLDDDFCDPLSLRGESSLGVAGLTQAVRAGTVTVANALGSGLVETAALMAFLPGLCRRLLDEDLALPSVATWWCGEPEALAYVLDHLDELVLKPTFPAHGREPVFAARLSASERSELVARMRARPGDFVAQEQVALSTAPVWDGEALQPRHVVVRTFLAAAPGGYDVMPGALTRVGVTPDSLVVSMQRGGGSKDTWVLADGPVGTMTLLRPAGQPVELSRGSALSSRVADDLFWLGRYVERAEGLARLLRGAFARLANESGLAGSPELGPLVAALAAYAQVEDDFQGDDARALETALRTFVLAESPRRTLRATLASGQHLGAIARDQISLDTWRVLSQLDRDLAALEERFAPTLGDVLDALNGLILSLAALSGLGNESMTRGQGWRFTDMGRRMERVHYTTNLLHHTLARPSDDPDAVLEALLEVADSSMTYRRRYLGGLEASPVLDLLLVDETNPRSVAFQLVVLDEHVRALPRASARLRSPEERVATAALTRVRLAEVGPLCVAEPDGTRGPLADLLAELASDMRALSDVVARQYLSHTQTSRRLGGV